jgi:hypothetical protein
MILLLYRVFKGNNVDNSGLKLNTYYNFEQKPLILRNTRARERVMISTDRKNLLDNTKYCDKSYKHGNGIHIP